MNCAEINKLQLKDATVSDWIGTASTSASAAVGLLESVRDGKAIDPLAALWTARAYLEQATGEAQAIAQRVMSETA